MLVLSPIFAARWGDSGAAASAILGWIVIVSGGAYLVATDFEKLELKN
jgi:hypothetical protein